MKRSLLMLIPILMLFSCAGYRLGGQKPTHLAQIQSIYVPLFVNDTQQVRADAYATNSAVDALTRDGTYKIGTADSADAVLDGVVKKIRYSQVSSSRLDTLRSEELSMTITIAWTLRDADNPALILEKGKSQGTTRFFTGDNLQVARTNALPDALQRASQAMTARLADGF